MNDESERVAVPERVDLRPVSLTADERVVGRDRAVVVEPQQFAAEAGRILGDLSDVAAGGHVDLAVRSEHDAAVQAGVAVEGIGHDRDPERP